MERLVILPFSIGCVSESSVATVAVQPRRSTNLIKPNVSPTSPIRTTRAEEENEESMKNSLRFLPLSKPDISNGIHRLVKGFKSFSQLFVNKDEDMKETESEMEIGFPTDVKHVTHIGWDDFPSTNLKNNDINNMNMGNGLIDPELLSLAPFSLLQFERTMPQSQTETNNAPLVVA
ncbi:hypothetical protein ACFE04_000755 [Oxalis oulophora]